MTRGWPGGAHVIHGGFAILRTQPQAHVQNSSEIRRMTQPLGVARIAREIRRQERKSDFNGYTVNYAVASLRDFLREVDGAKWVLSMVPLKMIKCAQTSMHVKDLLDTADSVSDRRRLSKQVRQMAQGIRLGTIVPGIFLLRDPGQAGSHWILDGHRRLLAHRIARVSSIPVYHPVDLFGPLEKGKSQDAQAH